MYHERTLRYRHQVEGALRAVGLLQASHVADWRTRHLADASQLSDNTLFAREVALWLRQSPPQQSTQTRVREQLRALVEHQRYVTAYLVDPQGRLRLQAQGDAQGHLPAPEQAALQRALHSATAQDVALHQAPMFAFAFFSVLAPLFDPEDNTPLGAVWLVVDPRVSLYPVLMAQLNGQQSEQSLLLTREGERVAYLNPLEPAPSLIGPPHGVLPWHQSLTDYPEDVAVQAVLGARGILSGRDYRGHNVLAIVSAVPQSPWVLLTKVDTQEVFADIQRSESLELALLVSLILFSAGCMVAFWQWRGRRRERALKRELQRNLRWLETAQKAASSGYFVYDPVRELFAMSSMACTIFGLPQQGGMTLHEWMGMLPPAERLQVLRTHSQAIEQHTPLRIQYRILRASDGAQRWVQVWGEYAQDGETGESRMSGTVQDITERKHTEEQLAQYRDRLEEKVRLDPLTQVANRLALDEAVRYAVRQAWHNNTPLAVLMMDVDHFKAYNDRYGHVAGDVCLQKVAAALAACVQREGEIVARYGGEEFAVVLPDTSGARAQGAAQRLCDAVRGLGIEHSGNPGRNCVTISVGVAGLQHAADEPPASDSALDTRIQELFQQADAALYRAKQSGRDQVAVYQAPTQAG